MKVSPILFALAVFAASAAPAPVVAAEPCPSAVGTPGNPAFGTPRPCTSATAVTKSPSAQAKGRPEVVRSTTPDGGTTYTWGDTTVTVHGSISADFGVVHGGTTR